MNRDVLKKIAMVILPFLALVAIICAIFAIKLAYDKIVSGRGAEGREVALKPVDYVTELEPLEDRNPVEDATVEDSTVNVYESESLKAETKAEAEGNSPSDESSLENSDYILDDPVLVVNGIVLTHTEWIREREDADIIRSAVEEFELKRGIAVKEAEILYLDEKNLVYELELKPGKFKLSVRVK